MGALNYSLWIAGLLLQALLLVLIFRRGLFRQVPIFAVLLMFYLVRAGLLYGLFSVISQDAYGRLRETLSLLDLAMQIVLLVDILIHVVRRTWTPDRNARVRAIALSVIAIGTALAAAWTPLHLRIAQDRGMVFTAILALFLALWMLVAGLAGPKRQIAFGFAAYGLLSIAVAFERSYAFAHRSSQLYMVGSYIQSGIYLCVILFWIFTLHASATGEPKNPSTKRRTVRARG